MPTAAKFPAAGAIQNFALTSGFNFSAPRMAVDWEGRRLFLYNTGTSLMQVNSLDTWAVTTAPTATGSFASGMQFGVDGNLYGVTLATNCGKLHKVDPTALGTDVATFGNASSGFGTTASTWAFPNDFDTVQGSGSAFLVSASVVANVHEVTVLNLTTMAWGGRNLTTDQGNGVVSRGSPNGSPQAFVVCANNPSTFLSLYQVLVSDLPNFVRVASIPAASINANWTHVSRLAALLLDETDGNVILHLTEDALQGWASSTSYSVGALVSSVGHDWQGLTASNLNNPPATSPSNWLDLGVSGPVEPRIVKISVASGAILWSVVLQATVPGVAPGLMQQSRIRFGLYCFFDNAVGPGSGLYNFHQIRTGSGIDTPQVLNNIQATWQFFDDSEGYLVMSCAYTQTSPPPPIPNGATPSSFAGAATLGSVTPPFQPAGGVAVLRGARVRLISNTVPGLSIVPPQ